MDSEPNNATNQQSALSNDDVRPISMQIKSVTKRKYTEIEVAGDTDMDT